MANGLLAVVRRDAKFECKLIYLYKHTRVYAMEMRLRELLTKTPKMLKAPIPATSHLTVLPIESINLFSHHSSKFAVCAAFVEISSQNTTQYQPH